MHRYRGRGNSAGRAQGSWPNLVHHTTGLFPQLRNTRGFHVGDDIMLFFDVDSNFLDVNVNFLFMLTSDVDVNFMNCKCAVGVNSEVDVERKRRRQRLTLKTPNNKIFETSVQLPLAERIAVFICVHRVRTKTQGGKRLHRDTGSGLYSTAHQ